MRGSAGESLLDESLDDLYEHAPCGYLSALADGTIVKVNQTLLDWTGYARDEIVGTTRFQDLLTPGGQIYHETHYAPLLRMQGEVREIALDIRCADSSRLPVLINSVLRTAKGSGQTVVRTTVFDARDRRAYEQELLLARRRESEARERVERLQRLAQALASTLDAREVLDATLDATMEAVSAGAGRIETTAIDGTALERLRGDRDLLGSDTQELELVASGRTLGRLALVIEGRTLSDAERSFLLACARQCAQALERARLHAQTVRDAHRATMLAELARALEEDRTYAGRARCLVQLLVRELVDEACVEALDDHGIRRVVARAASSPATLEDGIALPLRVRDVTLGELFVRGRGLALPDRRELLGEVADRAALSLENARLYEHEHRVADSLQRSMLTGTLPEHPRLALAAHYRPAVAQMTVGGDWYDAFEVADDRILLVVGDVVGRGIEAASAMGQLRSAVRALGGSAGGPGELLARLDDVVEHIELARYATLVCAELDLRTSTFAYACAGHPPPVLVGSDGSAQLLMDGRSAPLGVPPKWGTRARASISLAAGSRIFMYTDGLVERRDRPIDEGFGELLRAVRERSGTSLPAVVSGLPELLLRGDDSSDDVCLLGLSFLG